MDMKFTGDFDMKEIRVIREVKEEEMTKLTENLTEAVDSVHRTLSQSHDLFRQEWLGGGIKKTDKSAYKTPPDEILAIEDKIKKALKLLQEADHEAVMFLVANCMGDRDEE
jgi:hypothetical protein